MIHAEISAAAALSGDRSRVSLTHTHSQLVECGSRATTMTLKYARTLMHTSAEQNFTLGPEWQEEACLFAT